MRLTPLTHDITLSLLRWSNMMVACSPTASLSHKQYHTCTHNVPHDTNPWQPKLPGVHLVAEQEHRTIDPLREVRGSRAVYVHHFPRLLEALDTVQRPSWDVALPCERGQVYSRLFIVGKWNVPLLLAVSVRQVAQALQEAERLVPAQTIQLRRHKYTTLHCMHAPWQAARVIV